MKTKSKTIANALFTLAVLVGSAAPALAQQAPLSPDMAPAPVVVPPPHPEGRVVGEEVSPDEVGARAQYCQYQYQWVCNAWGQCMYQYVWVCL